MFAKELADLLVIKEVEGSVENITVEKLAQDSRKVVPNTMFFCIEGVTVDGHQFAGKAKELGASVFVASKSIKEQVGDSPVIYVKDVTRVMTLFANHFYGYPSESLNMIGVTGTNGKTTVTHMVDYLLEELGKPTALIGTMYRKIGDERIETRNTTPEILTVHETLQKVKEIGGDTCIMEVSSHALQLGRVWGIDYNVAVFTNLTHEHLDLHKTMENYAHAKSLLFSQLGNHSKNAKPRVAILNRDEEHFEQFAYSTHCEVISYGFSEKADIRATDVQTNGATTSFTVTMNGQELPVTIPMIGLFNVYNVLQLIQQGQPFQVIIDFAHTPDGLQNVLETLEKVKVNRVITIMGHSGGNRDSSMRPELGEIAFDKSDYVILTADNPRNEPLEKIYAEILAGRKDEQTAYECIDNRESAVKRALEIAQEGDILLFAGKGVEPYQVIGDEYIPYNEVETVIECLKAMGFKKGKIMIEVILSVGLAFLATAIAEPHFIQYMKMKQLGQTTLDEGPSWHKAKSGTPTMGGLVFLCMISISSLIVGAVFGHFNFVLLSGVIGFAFFGTIGFLDDFIKVFKKQNEGLKSHEKFGLQLIGAAIFVVLFLLSGNAPLIYLPIFGEVNSIILFALFTIIWIAGFSNAVNLTDGLDGLAASTNIIAYGIYGIMAYRAAQHSIAIFCFCVVGGLLGFLVYNWKPAKVFMGDVGSLALGAGLAIISIMLHKEWTLLLVGIIFVGETLSVILQVGSFKLTGKRIFKMSPIHHHFEMSGWKEVKIVSVFSAIGLVAGLIVAFVF